MVLGFLLFSAAGILKAVDLKTKEPDLSIQSSRRQTEIEVVVAVANSSKGSIVVPFCGEMNGRLYLCDLAVRMDVYSGNRWQEASAKCDYCGLPGGVALEECVTVKSGQTTSLVYQFASDYFRVARGQRVRLVLDVWPNKDSLKKREGATKISSPAFVLP